jgi:hypothetical protein
MRVNVLAKARWSWMIPTLCFYSPLMGPSGYPTYLVTASQVLARDQPKGIKPVTLLALRLLKDSTDVRDKARSAFTSEHVSVDYRDESLMLHPGSLLY